MAHSFEIEIQAYQFLDQVPSTSFVSNRLGKGSAREKSCGFAAQDAYHA